MENTTYIGQVKVIDLMKLDENGNPTNEVWGDDFDCPEYFEFRDIDELLDIVSGICSYESNEREITFDEVDGMRYLRITYPSVEVDNELFRCDIYVDVAKKLSREEIEELADS